MVKGVLFVCLGNICRSPMAEGVFNNIINEHGIADKFNVDSAGLGGWHTGNAPDKRCRNIFKKYRIPYSNVARQIEIDDFHTFHYIFGMDDDNIAELMKRKPENSNAKILLLGDFNTIGDKRQQIRDPYYDSGSDGFEECYKQCLDSITGFLKHLQEADEL